jgi:hypothetical protein
MPLTTRGWALSKQLAIIILDMICVEWIKSIAAPLSNPRPNIIRVAIAHSGFILN